MKSYELDTHNLYSFRKGVLNWGGSKHEHEWRIRRLEENDKTMLSTLNEIKLGQNPRAS